GRTESGSSLAFLPAPGPSRRRPAWPQSAAACALWWAHLAELGGVVVVPALGLARLTDRARLRRVRAVLGRGVVRPAVRLAHGLGAQAKFPACSGTAGQAEQPHHQQTNYRRRLATIHRSPPFRLCPWGRFTDHAARPIFCLALSRPTGSGARADRVRQEGIRPYLIWDLCPVMNPSDRRAPTWYDACTEPRDTGIVIRLEEQRSAIAGACRGRRRHRGAAPGGDR